MGLRDSVKRSLGYEVDESNFNDTPRTNSEVFGEFAKGISNAFTGTFGRQADRNIESANGYRQEPDPNYDYDYYDDDFSISPEYSLYELILIRPKSLDDINYVVDQVLDNNNPVIVDLSFLQREDPETFRLAGEKVRKMRTDYGVESFLISKCDNRNMIIIAPSSVKIIKKD